MNKNIKIYKKQKIFLRCKNLYNQDKNKYVNKIGFIFSLLIILIIINISFFLPSNNLSYPNNKNYFKVKSFYELFNPSIQNSYNKKILIFEPNTYHHECTPGYTKYFIDLGYNVHILLHTKGIDSFCLFEEKDKVQFFVFEHLKLINRNSEILSSIIQKYDFVLLETTDPQKKNLYNKLGFYNINNSIFVYHYIENIGGEYARYINQNRIWALGNFQKVLFVNPHYFGDIKIKDKNKKTRFFVTSSVGRNYKFLLEASQRLKNEKFDFEIYITGRTSIFNSKKIYKNLEDIYFFKHKANYSEFYNIVESSDFIILPLDPHSKKDNEYRKFRASGSIQLVYGFLKPVIINEEFANIYFLNNRNSLLYNNNNFYEIMKKAILLNNKKYKKIQNNIYLLEKEIYNISINNVKNTMKSINGF